MLILKRILFFIPLTLYVAGIYSPIIVFLTIGYLISWIAVRENSIFTTLLDKTMDGPLLTPINAYVDMQ